MSIMHFNEIFTRYRDGSIAPIYPIKINGSRIREGIRISRGTRIAGIDFVLLGERDMEVKKDNDGGLIIVGLYQ